MVVVEQQHGEKAEWERHKYPANVQVPKVNDPVALLCGLEGFSDWHEGNVSALQSPGDMRKADPEQCREDEGVVGENTTKPRLPDGTGA
jgi:hypothetical protein